MVVQEIHSIRFRQKRGPNGRPFIHPHIVADGFVNFVGNPPISFYIFSKLPAPAIYLTRFNKRPSTDFKEFLIKTRIVGELEGIIWAEFSNFIDHVKAFIDNFRGTDPKILIESCNWLKRANFCRRYHDKTPNLPTHSARVSRVKEFLQLQTKSGKENRELVTFIWSAFQDWNWRHDKEKSVRTEKKQFCHIMKQLGYFSKVAKLNKREQKMLTGFPNILKQTKSQRVYLNLSLNSYDRLGIRDFCLPETSKRKIIPSIALISNVESRDGPTADVF